MHKISAEISSAHRRLFILCTVLFTCVAHLFLRFINLKQEFVQFVKEDLNKYRVSFESVFRSLSPPAHNSYHCSLVSTTINLFTGSQSKFRSFSRLVLERCSRRIVVGSGYHDNSRVSDCKL